VRAEPAAIVTGGGGGIGRAASLALASGGARVLVVRTSANVSGDPSGFVERIPVGRYGRPEDIAALVARLLLESPQILTGAVLPIDGGMTVP
jgi:NAD(P)-dependent dehydrogenase (short-subunit alcohol dehydrogenase family)